MNLDFNELDGFQSPKNRAITDWQARKQAEAFEKLCRRLYKNKWEREHGNEKRRAHSRDSARKQQQRARAKRVYECTVCRTQWCLVGKGGLRRQCSAKCRSVQVLTNKRLSARKRRKRIEG